MKQLLVVMVCLCLVGCGSAGATEFEDDLDMNDDITGNLVVDTIE